MDSYASVEPEFVEKCVKDLRKGKAPGVDLLAASRVISPVLSNLFTCILRLGHIPTEMKTRKTFTLHKEGKKSIQITTGP